HRLSVVRLQVRDTPTMVDIAEVPDVEVPGGVRGRENAGGRTERDVVDLTALSIPPRHLRHPPAVVELPDRDEPVAVAGAQPLARSVDPDRENEGCQAGGARRLRSRELARRLRPRAAARSGWERRHVVAHP